MKKRKFGTAGGRPGRRRYDEPERAVSGKDKGREKPKEGKTKEGKREGRRINTP